MAKEAISQGAATRYEMAIGQGLRKRQGQARSTFFLEALKIFKASSFHPAEEVVHMGLLTAALAECQAGGQVQQVTEESKAKAKAESSAPKKVKRGKS